MQRGSIDSIELEISPSTTPCIYLKQFEIENISINPELTKIFVEVLNCEFIYFEILGKWTEQ